MKSRRPFSKIYLRRRFTEVKRFISTKAKIKNDIPKRLKQRWINEADVAIERQNPLNSQKILYVIFFSLIVLLGWSYFAHLDEITKGHGKIIASKKLQIVQSLDGGVVEKILVSEGDLISANQPVLLIDQTRALSKLNESKSRVYALAARFAMLWALTTNSKLVFDNKLLREAPFVVETEKDLFKHYKAELAEKLAVFESQLRQQNLDLEEFKLLKTQNEEALKLEKQELKLTLPLLAKGAVSELDIIKLKRKILAIQIELNQAESGVKKTLEKISELKKHIAEVKLSVMNAWRLEFAETSKELDALNNKVNDLLHKVKTTEISSPVAGIVQRILVNTVGGVVSPGQNVMEITPINDVMLLEAQIPPKDIAFIHLGQKAKIKMTAYDFATYGGLEAQVNHISSDTVTDDDGNSFFIVRLKITDAPEGKKIKIKPGMMADVDILTGKKTVLEYLIKPVLKATSSAMTEK